MFSCYSHLATPDSAAKAADLAPGRDFASVRLRTQRRARARALLSPLESLPRTRLRQYGLIANTAARACVQPAADDVLSVPVDWKAPHQEAGDDVEQGRDE